MYPNKAENFCCTGGGGAMSMSEYAPRRLKSAVIKAEQLRATGAEVVVTSCHNCVDGLADLIKHYGLKMQVKQLVDLVADAMVPEVCAGAAKVAVPEKVKPAASLKGKRILIAEDEPDILEFLGAALEDHGATVIRAGNGNEALALAKKEKPDLITLDLQMPGMDGAQVFEALRAAPELNALKVLIVSGKPELRKVIYETKSLPPEGFINKPVDEETLLLNVRKALQVPHGG